MTQDSVEHLKIKVAEVTAVMQENVQFALKNTDKMENIEAKSDLLMTSSDTFRKSATHLKHKICYQYWKCILIAAILIAIIVLIVIVS